MINKKQYINNLSLGEYLLCGMGAVIVWILEFGESD
tara:strand:- start:16 stop:123 length:108 start_codon:yes stop_codon:yes gene_type:complete